jgi:hypothetical protein
MYGFLDQETRLFHRIRSVAPIDAPVRQRLRIEYALRLESDDADEYGGTLRAASSVAREQTDGNRGSLQAALPGGGGYVEIMKGNKVRGSCLYVSSTASGPVSDGCETVLSPSTSGPATPTPHQVPHLWTGRPRGVKADLDLRSQMSDSRLGSVRLWSDIDVCNLTKQSVSVSCCQRLRPDPGDRPGGIRP